MGWGEGPLTHLDPTQSFDKAELLECIRRLVEVDKDWVPGSAGTSLYVRPVFIGNEVGLPPGTGRTVGLGNQTRVGGPWSLMPPAHRSPL